MINLMFVIAFFLVCLLIVLGSMYETWCNTYTGWPGPIENGRGRYNIPALYGRGRKYEGKCHFKYGLDKNSSYMPMKGYPCG